MALPVERRWKREDMVEGSVMKTIHHWYVLPSDGLACTPKSLDAGWWYSSILRLITLGRKPFGQKHGFGGIVVGADFACGRPNSALWQHALARRPRLLLYKPWFPDAAYYISITFEDIHNHVARSRDSP